MEYFFGDTGRQRELKRILDEWRGTPYRHWAGVKGLGCDCIHFIVRVLEELGLGPFTVPRYARDWHMHNSEELLFDGITNGLEQEEVGFASPMNGDIMLFQFGKAISHSAIYYDKYLYQAINNVGVEKINWMDNKWHKRKRFNFRILA